MNRPMDLAIVLLSLFFLTPGGQGSIQCPLPDTIAPCTCEPISEKLSCMGSSVTQKHIDDLFSLVRAENDLTPTDWLNISGFEVLQTLLTQIDLTPLIQMEVDVVRIEDNVDLTSFTASGAENGTSTSFDLINVYSILLSRNSLSDEGVQTLFEMATGSIVKLITADENRFRGSLDGTEFLPGMAHLVDLRTLQLLKNFITTLKGGQFRTNRRIGSLILSDNLISEIGENAFLFDDPLTEDLDRNLQIQLDGNKISDANINPNNDLAHVQRPILLYMGNNQMVHLSVQNFEAFLYADFRNVLSLQANAFVCDSRMKWVRDAKPLLENRVYGVDCVNDPGFNIFNTELDLSN